MSKLPCDHCIMMITTANGAEARQDFVEIPLYGTTRWYVYAPIILALLTALVLTVDLSFYLMLGISITTVAFSLLSLCLLLVLSYRYRRFLFPASRGTLMIAYGELYLVVQKRIQWSVSLKHCQVEKFQARDTQLPTLRLYDQRQLPIRIQYLRQMPCQQPLDVVENSAYGIFSSADWHRLTKALEHKYTLLE
ncbi:MAG: hypothetical protein AAF597_01940 [Bacteroidota bacterium]